MPRNPKAPQLKPFHFKPGVSGNPKGRPAEPIPNALKKLTGQQIRRIIAATVKGNIPELKRIITDNKSSALEVAMAKCLVVAVQKGDYDTIEKMLQRTGAIKKIPDEVHVRSKNLNVNANANIDSKKVKAVLEKIQEEV